MTTMKKMSTTFFDGINQNTEQFSLTQCFDARNVWCPDGAVVRRGGARGLFSTIYGVDTPQGASGIMINEDVSLGVFTTSVAGVGATLALTGAVGDRVYFNLSHATWAGSPFLTGAAGRLAPLGSIVVTTTAANVAASRFMLEAFTGQGWTQFHCVLTSTNVLFGGVASRLNFALPLVVRTEVEGYLDYWIRVTILDVALTAGTTIDNADGCDFCSCEIGPYWNINGIEHVQKRGSYILASGGGGGGGGYTRMTRCYSGNFYVSKESCVYTSYEAIQNNHLGAASVCRVDNANTLFIGVDNSWIEVNYNNASNNTAGARAQVETLDFAIGPGAPYDVTVFALDQTWPKAKFLAFHENRLWAVDENKIKWSGPVPYHKVWPSLCFEYIEGDNSATTGVVSAWSRLYIFKQNSIRASVYTGNDSFENPRYVFPKVAGVGAVAPQSIKMTNRNELVFLAEDGLFALTSDNTVRKVTLWATQEDEAVDRLCITMRSISPGARAYSAGINIKSRGVYLLSVPVNGSLVNNLTIVWDYTRNTFWLWDGFNAQAWLSVENEFGNEEIFFIDDFGRVYVLSDLSTDQGAPLYPYVKTHSMGHKQNKAFLLRGVTVHGSNLNGDTLSIESQMDKSGVIKTCALDYNDWHEKKLGEFVLGLDRLTAIRPRIRSASFRQIGTEAEIVVKSNSPDHDFEADKVSVDYIVIGERRND